MIDLDNVILDQDVTVEDNTGARYVLREGSTFLCTRGVTGRGSYERIISIHKIRKYNGNVILRYTIDNADGQRLRNLRVPRAHIEEYFGASYTRNIREID